MLYLAQNYWFLRFGEKISSFVVKKTFRLDKKIDLSELILISPQFFNGYGKEYQ